MTDQTKLATLASTVPPGSPLKAALDEVVAMVPKVVTWERVPTSGSAACRYDIATELPRGYEIRYQQGNMGNLVHELIHAAVNESYGQDFINYPNPDATPVARVYDASGRCTNEEARQGAYMRGAGAAAALGKIDNNLQMLTGWANASSELSVTQRSDIVGKLSYGRINPQKEYDTVITQVLVWLHEWDFPLVGNFANKPIVNALFEEVSKIVGEANRNRRSAKAALHAARNKAIIDETITARRKAMRLDD